MASSTITGVSPVQEATRAVHGGLILYDAAQAGKVHEHVFTPAYWRARDALSEPLGGRGAAWRIAVGDIDWVMRFYRRGGVPGKLFLDSYFYTGMERTRPWREWRLLAWMCERNLPVPRPVAARVLRGAMTYRGALITETVPGRSLAALLEAGAMTQASWRAIGKCVRRFHDAGVWHADLNAHNILVDGEARVYLIDFDRGRLRAQDAAWRNANLARLQRSLVKISPPGRQAAAGEGMDVLRAAYNGD